MSEEGGGKGAAPVSWRAVGVGTALVGVIGVVSPWAILVVKGSQLTSNAVPIIAVLFLFGLAGVVVPLLKLIRRRLAFSRGELITVYVMMLVGSAVVTTGFTGCFLTLISGPLYYTTPENNWGTLILPHIHEWLTPTDRAAVAGFYEGLPRGAAIPWGAWLVPLAAWLPFVLVFYWVILCLGTMLRGQWMENERLVFPLTRRPLALIDGIDDGRSFVSPVL